MKFDRLREMVLQILSGNDVVDRPSNLLILILQNFFEGGMTNIKYKLKINEVY